MKIGLLSDIHANLPAFTAVLEDLKIQKPDVVYCLGDLVGYNVWPNQVIQMIRENGIATIAGNHDLKVAKILPSEANCKTENDKDYAYKLVGKEEKEYLLSLPSHLRLDFQLNNDALSMLLVHGSPRSINEYLYEDLPEDYMFEMLKEFKADILCFGHSHKPYHRILKSGSDGNNHFHHLINTGSVGKPKDGDPRACYVILTIPQSMTTTSEKALQVEFRKVRYDIEEAAIAIDTSPLPKSFAESLRNAY